MKIRKIYSDVVELSKLCPLCDKMHIVYARPCLSENKESFYERIWSDYEFKCSKIVHDYKEIKTRMDNFLNKDVLGRYLLNSVIPLYKNLDDYAHGFNHIYTVLENSVEINKLLDNDLDKIKTIAVCHDIGVSEGRDNHEIRSAEWFYNNTFFTEYFSKEDRDIIYTAIQEHRSSNKISSSSIYSDIIREADRNIEPSIIFGRYYSARFKDTKISEDILRNFVNEILEELKVRYLHDTSNVLPIGLSKNLEHLVTLRREYLEIPAEESVDKIIRIFYSNK